MPAVLAMPAFWGAVGAGAAGTAGIVGAKMQSGAAREGAKLQTDAATRAAEVQDAAAQRAEAFQRQQAENEWQNAQSTQRANYEQSKARYGSIAGVASQYGLNLGGMPDYVPGIDPHYDTGVSAPGTVAGATPTPAAGVPADLQTAMQQANQIAYGGQQKHTDPNYWQALWTKDPDYAYRRMLGEGAGPQDAATSGPYAGKATAAAAKGSIAALPSVLQPAGVAPNVDIPTPYQPGSIAYGRMR